MMAETHRAKQAYFQLHLKHTKNRSAFALRFRDEVLAIKKFTYAQLFYKESYTVERNKGQAAELYATAKQKGAAEDVAVFQAKYDKAMTQAGYVRYGVKDATGTLALAAIAGIPALRPEPFDEETNPPPQTTRAFRLSYGAVWNARADQRQTQLPAGRKNGKNLVGKRNIYPFDIRFFPHIAGGGDFSRALQKQRRARVLLCFVLKISRAACLSHGVSARKA